MEYDEAAVMKHGLNNVDQQADLAATTAAPSLSSSSCQPTGVVSGKGDAPLLLPNCDSPSAVAAASLLAQAALPVALALLLLLLLPAMSLLVLLLPARVNTCTCLKMYVDCCCDSPSCSGASLAAAAFSLSRSTLCTAAHLYCLHRHSAL
jgi:hypothetical protein